jgi:hypothetical protein
VLRVACDEAVWAAELELLGAELIPRLAAGAPAARITSMRCSADRRDGP